MGKLVKVSLALVVVGLTVVTASLATTAKSTASDTLVFAASADPVSLDPAVTSDGESFRAQLQIYETLVSQVPGTTKLAPGLAVGWKVSPNGGSAGRSSCARTCASTTARRSTPRPSARTSTAGTTSPARSSPTPRRTTTTSSSAASRSRRRARPARRKALYRNCVAQGASTAVINLKRRFAPFLGAMTLGPFAIQSPTAMKQYGADKGKLTADGVFVPLGTYGAPGGQAVGTGPFKLSSWRIGDKLELVRNDSYWGKKAFLSRVIIRPISDNAARLQALQTGEIQGYDNVEPQDVATIQKSIEAEDASTGRRSTSAT